MSGHLLIPISGCSCRDSSPLRDVFTVRLPAKAVAAPSAALDHGHSEEKQDFDRGQVTVICSEEAGTQIIQHQDSLTDYCSISSSGTQEAPGSPGSTAFNSLTPSSSELGRECSDRDRQESGDSEPPPEAAQIIPNPPPLKLQAFAVLPVNGTLWIPR